MKTFAEIDSKTQWALEIETDSGYRYWVHGTMKKIRPVINRAVRDYGGISDLDLCWWEHQPADIRLFHKAYSEHGRGMTMQEFYRKEWNKAAA